MRHRPIRPRPIRPRRRSTFDGIVVEHPSSRSSSSASISRSRSRSVLLISGSVGSIARNEPSRASRSIARSGIGGGRTEANDDGHPTGVRSTRERQQRCTVASRQRLGGLASTDDRAQRRCIGGGLRPRSVDHPSTEVDQRRRHRRRTAPWRAPARARRPGRDHVRSSSPPYEWSHGRPMVARCAAAPGVTRRRRRGSGRPS